MGRGGSATGLLKRVPPQSLEAEQATLGAMLMEREAIVRATVVVKSGDFYSPQHAELFRCLLDLFEAKQPVDLVTVQAALQQRGRLEAVGGVSYLIDLQDSAPTAQAVQQYAQIVLECAQRRELITLGGRLQEAAQAGEAEVATLCAQAGEEVYRMGARRPQDSFEPIGQVALRTLNAMAAQEQNDSRLLGISSELADVDTLTCGWCKGVYYVIAAHPSLGKSAFLWQVAETAARAGRGVAFFSLEMANDQLYRRLLARKLRRELAFVLRARLGSGEWEQAWACGEEAQRLPLWMCERGGMRIADLRAQVRYLATQHKLDMVCVDYIQLLAGSDENEELTATSHGLQELAREYQVALLAASQLRRESRGMGKRRYPRPRPSLDDLRGSGSIEQDADLVAFLHDPRESEEAADNQREFLIRKQRNGPTGVVRLHWSDRWQTFSNAAHTGGLEYGD